MRNILRLLKRFRSDEGGAFLVIFGVLAIVLVATAGAVVDYATIEQARARAQDALDSAALGLQPTIFEQGVTAETIKPKAEALLIERLADASLTAAIEDVAINMTDGSLKLQASVVIPTAFVSLVGVPSIKAGVLSEATRKRLKVEVAMVLDNSGSMNSSSRMTNLKAAAKCATGVLLNGDCNSTATTSAIETVKIGIVPFTEFVNVGTAYKDAAWIDQTGISSIANDNFDDDDRDDTPFTSPVNRFALYDQLSNVSWKGCVEARPYPYDTDDTVPDPANPDTLFVPEFAPDTPDSGFTNNYLSDSGATCRVPPTWTRIQVKENCTNSTNSSYYWSYCSSSASNDYQQTNEWGASVAASTSAPANNSPESYWNEGSCTGWQYHAAVQTSWWPTRYRYTRTMTCIYDFSEREKQERLCKYSGNIYTSGGRGPNWDCPTNALLPLTNTKSSITAAIDAMYPQGYTNIHQGAIWGFHMLAPTEPLTEAEPYTSGTYKVMIVMTDGENTVQGYKSWLPINKSDGYLAYGYPDNGRIFSSAYPNPSSDGQVTSAMNSRTVETCTNAKAKGITVYTIGLNSPNATTTQMLKDCASGESNAYFPTASSELISVFEEIASQLSNLRLAQ